MTQDIHSDRFEILTRFITMIHLKSTLDSNKIKLSIQIGEVLLKV